MGWVANATSRPLYPRESPGNHCIGGWVGPRACLEGCGKSHPTRIQSPDRPARSESLYRLRHPGPQWGMERVYKLIIPLLVTYFVIVIRVRM